MIFECLNPDMAWALLGILAPVVIHFLIRSKAKIFPFSVIFFLKKTIQKKNQKIRFSQFLLLLCRMALVLFLAIAVMKPTLQALPGFLGSLRAETDWVIIVDSSLSMRMKNGESSRFSVMQKQFLDFLYLLSEKDRVTILNTEGDFLSKIFEPVSLENTFVWEKRLKPGFGKSDLLTMVQRAESLLDRSSRIEKAIVLFSDFQVLEAKPLLDHWKNKKKLIRTLLIPSGKTELTQHNLYLSSLEIPMTPSCNGNQIPVEIKVASKGAGICHGTLEILQDGQRITEVSLSLDDTIEITKTVLLERTTNTVLEGRLSGDDFTADNQFYALFQGHSVFKVVDVEGAPTDRNKNFYISSALDPFLSQGMEGKTPFHLNTVKTLADASLRDTDVVLVSDLLDLSEEDLLRLEEFIHAGGGLVTGFGNLASASEYERRLSGPFRKEGGLLPGKLRQILIKEGLDANIRLSDEKKNELSKFQDPTLWAQAKTNKLMQLESPETAPVWLRAGKDPLLLVKPYGKGSVAWFMTKLAPDGTTLVLQGVFVPLLHAVMETLLASKKPKLFHTVGERLRFHSNANLKDLSCLDPLGEKIEILAEEKGNHAVLARSPGIYKIFEKERCLKSFAVNVPKEEADLEVLSPQDLKSMSSQDLFSGTETIKLFLDKGKSRIPLWRLFLYFVLGCLVLEMFLIWKLRG